MQRAAPPPVQMPTAPGVVQTVPALVDSAEQWPDVVPAVQTRPQNSSASSTFRQLPPVQLALTVHCAPTFVDL